MGTSAEKLIKTLAYMYMLNDKKGGPHARAVYEQPVSLFPDLLTAVTNVGSSPALSM